jgi:hypothetical protein
MRIGDKCRVNGDFGAYLRSRGGLSPRGPLSFPKNVEGLTR